MYIIIIIIIYKIIISKMHIMTIYMLIHTNILLYFLA
jgi:hypothetical protein